MTARTHHFPAGKPASISQNSSRRSDYHDYHPPSVHSPMYRHPAPASARLERGPVISSDAAARRDGADPLPRPADRAEFDDPQGFGDHGSQWERPSQRHHQV